jgi:hypothetical protein
MDEGTALSLMLHLAEGVFGEIRNNGVKSVLKKPSSIAIYRHMLKERNLVRITYPNLRYSFVVNE